MNAETYLNLLSLITPLIEKQGVIMRETATPLHHTTDYSNIVVSRDRKELCKPEIFN
jgi:hypothetical protein